MKFYGKGVVWDGDSNQALCRFSKAPRRKDGVFETEDPRTIKILTDRGYKFEGQQHKGEAPQKTKQPTKDKIAKEEIQKAEPPKSEQPKAELPKDDVSEDGLSLEELKEEAIGLGISFAYNIGKEKLLQKIEEAKAKNLEGEGVEDDS